MKLIITRHGETEEKVAGILMGHLSGTLSKKGIEQAKKLALRLKDEKIDFIYSSDLARAVNTTKEIIKYHKNIPTEFTEKLRERNLGELSGKKKKTSDVGLDKIKFKNTFFVKSKTTEQNNELYDRANEFLEKILKKHEHNDTIMIVGHSDIDDAITSVLMKTGIEGIEKPVGFKNTSLSIFDIDKNGNCKMILFNDTKHLD